MDTISSLASATRMQHKGQTAGTSSAPKHLADQAILCPREASLIAAGRPQVSPRAAPRWHFYCDNEQFSDCEGNFSAVLTNLPAPRGLDDE